MELDETYLDLGSVSPKAAKYLNVKPWDVLQLSLSFQLPDSNSTETESISCIVQIVVRTSDVDEHSIPFVKRGSHDETTISIHPALYDSLLTTFLTIQDMGSTILEGTNDKQNIQVSMVPLAIPGVLGNASDFVNSETTPLKKWTSTKPVGSLQTLPPGSFVSLVILYMDDELRRECEKHESQSFLETLQSTISFFLAGRILQAGTTTVLSTIDGMAVARVEEIKENNDDTSTEEKASLVPYKIGDPEQYQFEISDQTIGANDLPTEDPNQTASSNTFMMSWQKECAGYEKLVKTVFQLTSLRGPSAPSGVVLTGSPQVGKTHLASVVAYQLSKIKKTTSVHWVSAQDLLLQASWASESDLLAQLRPPPRRSKDDRLQLLVIDDLSIFATDESALGGDSVSLPVDPEILVVRNAILQIMDEVSMSNQVDKGQGSGMAILAIAQTTSNLPADFCRSGRLEKEVTMYPPTESQRELILRQILKSLDVPEGRIHKWAEALCTVTVGCVAGDLRRILATAWTKAAARDYNVEEQHRVPRPEIQWEDVFKAAQLHVPIQLESVDVCKPTSFISGDPTNEMSKDGIDPNDWVKVHELSWKKFGGYPKIKKRVLRTVVGPWKRFLKLTDTEDDSTTVGPSTTTGISPPPGVLFHGVSGNGKSFAAVCLGSSLGLPMIKIRASEVMDKWLGGSEAIIRSLFARARAAAPCILFFDEIDAIATNRASGEEGGAEVMSRMLSTLLNEMDGISSDKRRHSIIVVACTNRLDALDTALLRPGRLEEHIHLDFPDKSDVKEILQIHLSRAPLSDTVDLDEWAEELVKRRATGADVEGICREGCLEAVHRTFEAKMKKPILTREDLEKALKMSRLRD